MSEPNSTSNRTVSPRNAGLYRAALQQATAGGEVLMGKLIASARSSLQTQESASRDLRERDAFAESAAILRRHEQQLCKSFPQALLKIFTAPEGPKKGATVSAVDVHFDQLELMDESQVQSTVTLARVQQSANLVTEGGLAELNTLICSVLGMERVQPDANVLRPESYVNALQEVVEQTLAPHTMQVQWYGAMAETLGRELRILYAGLIKQLRQEGVVAATYAMPQGAGARRVTNPQAQVGRAEYAAVQSNLAAALNEAPPPARSKDPALLTLDKLRKLLSGELASGAPTSRVEQFAAQFSRQYGDGDAQDSVINSYDSTFPAALEALTEMKQVERVVQTLEQRRGEAFTAPKPQDDSIESVRIQLRKGVRDAAQALSLEVVTLMVDNMAHDARLLEPVREVIRNLEPALLRLALVDQRFFTDKQHAARRLLQALSHHSMAFDSREAAGFEQFYQGLLSVLTPLFSAPIDSADIFEQKLETLQHEWNSSTQATLKDREAAVEVLRHAEARNLLAESIARGIEARPDCANVPSVVIDFLCGPWSQVMAHARIKEGAGSEAAERYEELIPALLWSAHPELARANPTKLTRLVPRLIPVLREGLETIHYPAIRTGAFLESLMLIHQQFLRPRAATAVAPATAPATPAPAARVRRVQGSNPWIAPEEAAASKFVALEGVSIMPEQLESIAPPEEQAAPIAAAPEAAAVLEMPLGSWVEMWSNDQWVRTQLTWASPHGTLFLFTGVFGATQSMSRRLRDKLIATGKLRLIANHAFVDGALDAVAQVAMRNSVDTTY